MPNSQGIRRGGHPPFIYDRTKKIIVPSLTAVPIERLEGLCACPCVHVLPHVEYDYVTRQPYGPRAMTSRSDSIGQCGTSRHTVTNL